MAREKAAATMKKKRFDLKKQREMIARLKERQLAWVIHCDVPLDGRDDLRFRRSHALMWAYIEQHFTPIDVGWLGRGCALLERAKGA